MMNNISQGETASGGGGAGALLGSGGTPILSNGMDGGGSASSGTSTPLTSSAGYVSTPLEDAIEDDDPQSKCGKGWRPPSSSSLLQLPATLRHSMFATPNNPLTRRFAILCCGAAGVSLSDIGLDTTSSSSSSTSSSSSFSSSQHPPPSSSPPILSQLYSLLPSPPVRYSSKRPVWLQKGWFYFKRLVTPLPIFLTITLVSFIYYLTFPLAMDLLTEYDDTTFAATSEVPQVWAIRAFVQAFLGIGHVLLFLLLWSYFKAVFTPEIRWDRDDLEEELVEAKRRNENHLYPTFCGRCDDFRPCRAHHCGWCGRCVEKMDHHCPWIGRCIGRHNYKAFFLFVAYVTFTNLFIFLWALTCAAVGLHRWSDIWAVAMLTGLLSVSQGVLLMGHVYFVYRNVTTLEFILSFVLERDPEQKKWNPFDKGPRANFEEVFGSNRLLWFLPIRSPSTSRNRSRASNSSSIP